MRALTVCEAACQSSSVHAPTQSWICAFSARSRDAAVWATTPLRGSLKRCFVMAWRKMRRTICSSSPQAFEILANVASSRTGKLDAMLKRVIACILSSSSCLERCSASKGHENLLETHYETLKVVLWPEHQVSKLPRSINDRETSILYP